MKLRNFSLGINSYPASAPGSNHTTARDVLNLRVDGDGYLRLAPAVVDWITFGAPVTGIARAYDHLFFLRDDGELYVLKVDNPTLPDLVGSTDMRGKLSVIDEFETFFLFTSESDDTGYYYDVETDLLQALSYAETTKPSASIKSPVANGHTAGRFFYLFAEVKENDAVPDDTPAAAFHAPLSEGTFAGVTGGLGENRWQIDFSGLGFVNSDTTHIYVYRSTKVAGQVEDYDPLLSSEDALKFYTETSYRRIAKITRMSGDTTWTDDNTGDAAWIDSTDEGPNRWNADDEAAETALSHAYILGNGLPEFTRAWTHFNGYTFAATGKRLRYSQIEYGILKHAEFPEVNSINAPGDTKFVHKFDETLLFGDGRHLNVLRGYDPFNFQIYQVASVGPVTAYAGDVLGGGGFGFIAHDGFYVFDGQQVKEISTPQLDRFFENRFAVDGGVIPLPNGESLWSVELDNGTKYTFLLNTERLEAPTWTRLSAVFDQAASFPLEPLGEWSFDNGGEWYVDEGETWGYTDTETEALERVFLVRDRNEVEEYLWHDLKVAGRKNINWMWESNLIRGGSETVKVYDRLKLAGHSDNPLSVSFDLDIRGETVDKTVRDVAFNRNSRKKRIPIKRRANGLSFIVAGYGEVELREVELDSRVVGRV